MACKANAEALFPTSQTTPQWGTRDAPGVRTSPRDRRTRPSASGGPRPGTQGTSQELRRPNSYGLGEIFERNRTRWGNKEPASANLCLTSTKLSRMLGPPGEVERASSWNVDGATLSTCLVRVCVFRRRLRHLFGEQLSVVPHCTALSSGSLWPNSGQLRPIPGHISSISGNIWSNSPRTGADSGALVRRRGQCYVVFLLRACLLALEARTHTLPLVIWVALHWPTPRQV